MSWFEKAKTVLIEALDIQDDDSKAAAATDKADPVAVAPTSASGDLKESEGPAAASSGGSGSLAASAATPASSSDKPTFFDNPHANEMVTIPPRASDPTPTTPSTSAPSYAKRQSATSDSVDLLSSPTSPVEEVSVSAASNKRNSESSLELITATTASELELEMELELSPDTEPSLPDSIVIIASNDTSDNAEGDGEDEDEGTQLERHMEDHLNGGYWQGKGGFKYGFLTDLVAGISSLTFLIGRNS